MKAITIAFLAVGFLVVLVAAKPQRSHHNKEVDQQRNPLESGEDQRPEAPPSGGDEDSQERPDKRPGQGQRPPHNHEHRPPHGQGPPHDHEHRPPHGHRPTPPPQEDSTTLEPEDSTTAEPEDTTTLAPEENTTL